MGFINECYHGVVQDQDGVISIADCWKEIISLKETVMLMHTSILNIEKKKVEIETIRKPSEPPQSLITCGMSKDKDKKFYSVIYTFCYH